MADADAKKCWHMNMRTGDNHTIHRLEVTQVIRMKFCDKEITIKLVNLIPKGILKCSFYRRVLWNSLVFSAPEQTTSRRPINCNHNSASTHFLMNMYVLVNASNCDLNDNISIWIVEPMEAK